MQRAPQDANEEAREGRDGRKKGLEGRWAVRDTILGESGVMGMICVKSADWIKSVGKIRGPVGRGEGEEEQFDSLLVSYR